MNQKRLFFAYNVSAPWPEKFPRGRLISTLQRHMTLSFLGTVDYEHLLSILENLPPCTSCIGSVGVFDQCLFLPNKQANVVAWHGKLIGDTAKIINFQKSLTLWSQLEGYSHDDIEREWLPHVTIARQPFDAAAWENVFKPLPFMLGDFCLYESLGNLNYAPIWKRSVTPPFEEIEHTADVAFNVYGQSLEQIYLHAMIAISFIFPPMLLYLEQNLKVNSLDDIIIFLNQFVYRADCSIGCPFKAVSFHGDLQILTNNILKWEMIIDV